LCWELEETLLYDLSIVADRVIDALGAAERDLRLEQAVYGLDSLDELSLQSLLARQLESHYGVAREVHYPSSAGLKRSHRMRCDLVLSRKGMPLRLETSEPTLFDRQDLCDPENALWVEVKIAYQFREGGARHGGYGAQWRSAVVADLRKIEADACIREAALLLIVFNESTSILEKDLELFENVLIQKEVLAGFRQVRSVPILDRIGHGICTVALWPTLQRG
jgi:hypothetical protein